MYPFLIISLTCDLVKSKEAEFRGVEAHTNHKEGKSFHPWHSSEPISTFIQGKMKMK